MGEGGGLRAAAAAARTGDWAAAATERWEAGEGGGDLGVSGRISGSKGSGGKGGGILGAAAEAGGRTIEPHRANTAPS